RQSAPRISRWYCVACDIEISRLSCPRYFSALFTCSSVTLRGPAKSTAVRKRSIALLQSPCSLLLFSAQISRISSGIIPASPKEALSLSIWNISDLEYGGNKTSSLPILERTLSSRSYPTSELLDIDITDSHRSFFRRFSSMVSNLKTKSDGSDLVSWNMTSNSSSVKTKNFFLSETSISSILFSIRSSALLIPSALFMDTTPSSDSIAFAQLNRVFDLLRFTNAVQATSEIHSHKKLTTLDFPVPLLPYTEMNGTE